MSGMKTVILKGDERHIEAIMRENKVRVSRGYIEFTPADSTPNLEGMTEEDVKDMVEAIEKKDARIAELMSENDSLKAALAEKTDNDANTDTPDTKEVEETDEKGVETPDTTEAPTEDTKEVEETPDAKGKRTSKK